jgi:hypothetical protein
VTHNGIVILGIPIPSSSPVFLAVVAAPVLVGLACVITGLIAMLSEKRPGHHPVAGTMYYWSLALVFASMSVLSVMRWPDDAHLFFLGALSFTAATLGRAARRRRWRGWLKHHIIGMALSYILLLTAFYVDNGANLPLWRNLPPLAYWITPSLVGLPILLHTLLRHPRILQQRAERDHVRAA